MKYDWNKLKLLALIMAAAIFFSAAIAITIGGFNQEGLRLFRVTLQKITAVSFWVFVILLLVFLWRGKAEQKLINQSRLHCRQAYQDLFDYLQANCLKGFDDPKCRQLHRVLERELNWHCEQYPFETEHPEVKQLKNYLRKTAALQTIKD